MAKGPRKELSFLDRALMNKAATQGGVLNFLGQQPEVTAPVRAQSHADSPPVELAYITDAEKDLLVKSNIHGSMAGKPNPGPAGIASLDDFFTTPGGGIGGGSTQDTGGSIGGGQGGQESAEDFGVQPGQAVTRPDDKGKGGGNVIAPNPDGSGGIITLTPEQVETQKKFNVNVMTGQGGIGQTENQAIGFQNFADKLAVQAATGSGGGFNILNFLPFYGTANLIGKGFDAIFKNPKAAQFLTDNFLSILKNKVLTTDEEIKRYYEDYKNEINKAGFGSLNAFTTALENAPEGGAQGEYSQYLADPASYLDEELYKQALIEDPDNPGEMISEYDLAMRKYPKLLSGLGLSPRSSRFNDQTTSGLLKIAQSNISQYKKFLPDGTANPNYNPDFLKKVFDARAQLQQQGVNPFTGNRQGDGESSVAGVGFNPSDPVPVPRPGPIPPPPQDPTLPPGITPPLNPNTRFPDSVIRDYTQLGLPSIYGNQQIPNYANFYQGQGGQPIGLQNYLDNLRKRFGIG